ncbi:hypothetical protein, partial [Belnapia rosea]|uniref:hypothetical protein n=1 Tax=Belnapia rosea TaxID=938405 RepID=UPI001C409580
MLIIARSTRGGVILCTRGRLRRRHIDNITRHRLIGRCRPVTTHVDRHSMILGSGVRARLRHIDRRIAVIARSTR